MRKFFSLLREKLAVTGSRQKFRTPHPADMQVMVPEAVVLPLPKTTREEISVPASINGRDLSSGRL